MTTRMKAVLATIPAWKTAGQTLRVEGFGFQPTAYILLINGRADVVDAVGRANCSTGMAFYGSKSVAAILNYDDNGASCVGRTNVSSTEYALPLQRTGATFDLLVHNSFLPDGILFTVEDAFSADVQMTVIGFAGDDITNLFSGFRMSGTATGNVDFNIGFDVGADTLLLFIGPLETIGSDPDPVTSGSTDLQFSLGAVYTGDATKQYVTAINSDVGAATMLTDSYSRKGEVLATIPLAGSAGCNFRASYVQSVTNGFRLNFADVSGVTRPFGVLAIKGGKFALGDFLTQTDTSTPIPISGLGIVPQCALVVSHGLPQSAADTTQNGARLSLGVCNDSPYQQQMVLALHDEDNTANQETSTGIRFGDLYGKIDSSSAFGGTMKATQFPKADGFDMLMSAADDAQNFGWFIAGGNPLIPPASGPGRAGLFDLDLKPSP